MHGLDIYSKTQVKIPAPLYLVFYNGTKNMYAQKNIGFQMLFYKKKRQADLSGQRDMESGAEFFQCGDGRLIIF